jgi:hypothetical protein
MSYSAGQISENSGICFADLSPLVEKSHDTGLLCFSSFFSLDLA